MMGALIIYGFAGTRKEVKLLKKHLENFIKNID